MLLGAGVEMGRLDAAAAAEVEDALAFRDLFAACCIGDAIGSIGLPLRCRIP